MDVKEIQKIALDNGFNLIKRPISNRDLNSYIAADFAKAVEDHIIQKSNAVHGLALVKETDTNDLDCEIGSLKDSLIESALLCNANIDLVDLIIDKAVMLGQLYERSEWQALGLEKAVTGYKGEIVTLQLEGEYKDWVRLDLEPINKYSDCGGRITVNIGDIFIGSYFFSHCGTKTFNEFIGQAYPAYLVDKLFKTPSKIFVENGQELIALLYENKELFNQIKELRKSNELSKSNLRYLYTEIIEKEFRDSCEFYSSLSERENVIISQIFDDDFMYRLSDDFKKSNPVYERQIEAIQEVIDYCSAYTQATQFVKKHGWDVAFIKVKEAQRLGFKKFSFRGVSYSEHVLIALVGLTESYTLCKEYEALEHGDEHPPLHKLKKAQEDIEACK